MYGLTSEDIHAIKEVFSRNAEIEKAILFGSRAKGNYKPSSDIDISLVGASITLTKLSEIEAELDDLLLPYKIDLSIYHKIENLEFVEHIDRIGIRLYEKWISWEEYRIDDVAKITTGYAFKGEDYEFKGKLRVVRGENVTIGSLRWDSEKFWNKEIKGIDNYLLKENDIVIGMDGSRVGHNRAKIKEKELPLILAQRVARLCAKNHFDQDFLWYHIFSSNFKDYVESVHTGTSIPHISQKQIGDFLILAPSSKSEQTAIASVLSSLDDKIDLLHRQNATLEKMAETMFRQWFVEEAKEEWEEKKLGEIVTITSSKRIFYSEYVTSGVPFYRSKEIIELRNNGATLSELYISLERFNDIDSKFGSPMEGDILMTSVGTLGVAYRVKPTDKFYFKDGNLTWFKNFREVPSSIIYLWLISKIGQDELSSITIGSTQQALTIDGLKNISFKIPPQNVIKRCDRNFNVIIKKIDANQSQIRTLTTLRDHLLPKLMSGEIRLKYK